MELDHFRCGKATWRSTFSNCCILNADLTLEIREQSAARHNYAHCVCLFVCLFVQQAATTKGHHHQAKIFSKTKKGYIQLQYSCQLMSELLRFLEYFTVSGLLQLRLQDVCRKLD